MNPTSAAESRPSSRTDDAGPSSEPPKDIASDRPRIELPECDAGVVQLLCDELELHPLVAQTLARRGVSTAAEAREWLADDSEIDAGRLPGVGEVAEAIAAHVRAGTRIAVHGDYDVDGVCATALTVRALSDLGADVTWHVPSRFDSGYGLSGSAIDSFAADGVGLVIAVDCGIGSIDEIARAKAAGVDVVVCDHHAVGETLPDAPIVHPAIGDYSNPGLCATAVVYKLANVLFSLQGEDPATLEGELELVALATVCDVMPLTGENRALVTRGIARMRRTSRPGLRELMRIAGVDQLKVDARTFGFALGPRINAAGRMGSAEPAVELLLTARDQRAAELAAELGAANARRREVERTVLFDAEEQALEQIDRNAIVVSGYGWHPGVLGIVAGRLADTYRRPVVALTIENGVASGSGRSGGDYDLLAGLTACAENLLRFGGHSAAAGVELDESALNEFCEQLADHAAASLDADDLRPTVCVDAIADPTDVTLETIEALERIGPFGATNREPAILIPAVRAEGVRKIGDRGQHRKFNLVGEGGRVGVVAFGWNAEIPSEDDAPPLNAVVELERNEFRGNVEPQAKLRTLLVSREPAADFWAEEFQAAMQAPSLTSSLAEVNRLDFDAAIDRRGESALAVLAELAPTAESTAVLANDVVGWREAISSLASVDRRLDAVTVRAYDDPRSADRRITRLVLVEPPPLPALAAFDDHSVVLAWSAAAARATLAGAENLLLGREHAVTLFRTVRAAPDSALEALLPHLKNTTPGPRIAARAVQALVEISVLSLDRSGGLVEAIHASDGASGDLEQSATFRSYSACKEESGRWLRQLTEDQTAQR